MKQILLVILLFCPIFAKKESLDDLSNLLNDPELLFELRKRFGNLLDDTIDDDDFTEPVVGCNALQGTLNGDCHFHTNESTIIKTTESIGKGATFIANVANITCARDCTAQCCSNEKCDTSVYQGKKDHNCYLFQCGQPSKCVFVQHEHYWMSSSSKEVHKSHQYTPGGTTQSHENELANLGAQDEQDSVDIPKTTKKPIMKTTKKPFPTTALTAAPVAPPELDEFCPSYTTVCADPHAVCLMQTCRCSVGYHKKNEVCRKHCRDEEFQCKEIGYGPIVTDCVHGSKVCNNKQDCDDGSDELDCPPEKDDKTAARPNKPGSFNKDEHKAIKPSVKPVATEAAPVKIVSTAGDKKDVPAVTTRKPIVTDAPVVVAAKQDLIDDQKAQSKSSESVKKIDEIPSESNADSVDNDSNSAEDSESNNETDSSQDVSNADKPFRFLNADTVEVDTYTDNSQGPIVALALGLSITMMLLIFVGCRLRTVKRRLRKGRALHSNEADYLINGMYL